MRSSIQRQFLLPVVVVVVVCFAGSSGIIAWLTTTWARQQEQAHLRHVLTALTDADFPLSRSVLDKMSELSEAEYVVLDGSGGIVETTLSLSTGELAEIAALPLESQPANLDTQPRLTVAGHSYLAARLPRKSRSTTAHLLSLVVLYPEDRWQAISHRLVLAPLVIGGIAAAVLVATISYVARQVTFPIRQLRTRAAAIAQGDFAPVALEARSEELHDLVRAIDDMAARLAQYAEQVRRNERLRTLGQLGGGIAHQLRNAATGARLALDLHRRACKSPEGQSLDDDSLLVATRQLALLESHVQRFLALGKTQPLRLQALDLATVVDSVLPLLRTTCEHAKIALEFTRPEVPIVVLGDPQALEQVLMNLMLNAIEAVRPIEGPRRISIALTASRDDVQLAVCDTGPGPQPAVAAQLFEPLVTDKPDGTGLGLTVARDLVVELGGRLEWRRQDGETWFIVYLPTGQSPAEPCEEPDGAIVDCR